MKKDAKGKYYLNNNRRIADFINGCCFGGRQEILPEEIQEENTRLIYVSEQDTCDIYKKNPDRKKEITEREHDLIFRVIRGVNCIIFGLEVQNYIDSSMVLRTLEYTTGQYMKQRHDILKKHREKKDLEKDEYVSGFSFRDLLKPVLVIVLYMGEDEWKGARTLHELLDWRDIPDEWREMFADYKMQLIEVQKLEKLNVFQTDLKLLFGFLQSKSDKEKLRRFMDENSRELKHIPLDLFLFMGAFGHTRQMEMIAEKNKECEDGGTIDMCKAIEDMINEGKIEGKIEGIERVNRLNAFLIAENRLDDLERATRDKEYQNRLFAVYAI